MKSAGDVVEIVEACDLTGSLRDAARLAGCSPMTVARYVRLRETGRLPTGRSAPRDQLVDPYLAKIEEWVERSHGRVRADVVHDKLRALGFDGSERTTRRTVARVKTAYAAPSTPPSACQSTYQCLPLLGQRPLVGEYARGDIDQVDVQSGPANTRRSGSTASGREPMKSRRPTAVSAVPTVKLNNGVAIPQLGFGVFQIKSEDTRAATLEALRVGYRHIDTAEMYGNEREVGEAVRDFGINRAEVFVTSKLNNGFHAHDDALAAFDRSLEVMKFDYVDLFLIHWPLPAVGDFVETWKALQEIHRSGRVRAIGVSNFQPHHLERLAAETTIVPAVNQIEIHPYFNQDDVRAFDRKHGIATEAWSPLAQGQVLDDPTIVRIAERLHRTPAQVTLRWHIQRGNIVFPKSVTPKRIAENFALFDFELLDEDMAAITALHRNGRRGPNPDEFNWIP